MITIVLAAALIVPPVPVMGPVEIDPRCKYTAPEQIPRDASGAISRSAAVRAQFMRANPCPSTGLRFGACKDWFLDHVVPLAKGGIDAPINLAWMHRTIKSCPRSSGIVCKDQSEMLIYRCWQ